VQVVLSNTIIDLIVVCDGVHITTIVTRKQCIVGQRRINNI